ncbi:MAG: acriflavin resistance protein [Deltaproteobacteria bacterium RIFCSPLOWO2_12_FULL_40_28]|nr:MAG: acriflavin resistance protein [Deltaproteobacteria bacterium RIFCSPHIGHO2_02_FULL_40_28]OGQ20693.1 MAG: acriflavin resistance protein [Deltaproteobacteria bacterium RIFCSPHIGHO2_12_FULL_40_32]OGQ38928.1 MAG: acriflavin resistance protein [Deltaproteobacteria bacterium RIFCSPLOWO2_02_FULL_40_36]OGQ55288.1 MAG: acriflavin resistance protein [Deltaproteobacteria bacterium RIFCSPLOWO2_12_FULL_40_28]
MTLSDLAIKRPVFAWMLMMGLIVIGWLCFNGMGISQLPDVDFPVVNVSVDLEGAAPEVMETQVTDVIEDALMTVQSIKEISSVSRQGRANITIEFELNRDIDLALQEVQTKIAQAQKNLPNEIDPPVVTKTNPEDQPIMWVGLSGNVSLRELMSYTHDVLKDKITTVPGVGDVMLGGYIDPNLRVWLDGNKMDQFQITVGDVSQAIRDEHQEKPAGYMEAGPKEMNVRVMGEAGSAHEFQNIIIPRRGGTPIWNTLRVGDVAFVEDGLNDIRRISRHMGVPAVGLGIKKQRGSNAVAVARAVKEKVAEIQKTLPAQYSLRVVFDTTKFIEDSTHELNFTLILSAILTGIVCWFFLGSWSSTVNVLLAIPTSIVGSFIFLYFMGFTLNTFTLLGLALAIGIVVDDAIMVLENIVRYCEMGFSRVKAAIVGAREITFAAMAASVSILAIFLPVVFMKGIVGKFFFQFGITMSVAVLLSLLEALTLAPMRCSQYLQIAHTSKMAQKVDHLMRLLTALYRKGLGWSLDNRLRVIIAAFSFFLFSLVLVVFIPKEFVPSQDQGRLLIRLKTPLGSSLSFTDGVAQKAESIVSGLGSVAQYYVAVGGFGGSEVNTAMMFVTLKPRDERPKKGWHHETGQDVMQTLRSQINKIPGVSQAVVQDPSLSGFSAQRGFPVEFSIRGPDWNQLGTLSATVMEKMKTTGLMEDIDSDYDLGMPELRITPDRAQAAKRGVSITSIAETINATIGGERVGKFTKNGKRYDIRVRLQGENRKTAEDISAIWVRNMHGELVSLADVVKIKEESTLINISRRNRERAISVFANVKQGSSQAKALGMVEKIARQSLPENYHVVFSGSSQTFAESFQSLIIALVLGIFVAYMVLGSQFNSFIHPVTVLMALPFSMTGAFLALLVGQQSLNIYSMIGIILLMGIVKKNSILLVDFTNERRKKGLKLHEALMEACPVRLRPILMTSFATIAGAIPPAIGLGPGAETRVPMALVVIGGVMVSTFLTLFVVPCVYSVLSRFESHKHDKNLREALVELGENN